jgi:pyruvate/2-oxoglutarate dehydrogenase complex dihydrolipoamide acyltransferase (E2) component
MPQIPIIMPQLGESIAEATVINFLVQPGGEVELDQDLIEVETSKATMTVASPCAGRLQKFTAELSGSYEVGAVLGYLDVTAEEAARAGLDTPHAAPHAKAEHPAVSHAAAAPAPAPAQAWRESQPAGRGLPVPAGAVGASYLSPRLKARLQELGLHPSDLAGIAGTGAGNRVTIEDLEKFIVGLEKFKVTPATGMRVAVADAMRRTWTRPLATVGLPTPIDNLLAHRRKMDPKPGPALYAARALAIALSENSAPAARLIGSKVVHPPAIDIGVAVEVDDGVIAPVLRGADKTQLTGLVKGYDDLVKLAQARKLPIEATVGAIATVTNFGTLGMVWATPLPLPDQTLILGMGAGRKAPTWDEAKGQFVPVTEANFTLSFDHRVIDGGMAGRLLKRVTDLLQTPEKL